MSASIKQIVEEQRKFWKSGVTRPLEFRKEQLRKLRNVVEQNSAALIEAVYKDLRRPHATNMKLEVEAILKNIDYALAHLDEWAAQQKFEKNEYGIPMVQYEPKGVVLVFSAWNYPVLLSLEPLLQAISAGNTVVLKPSEVSENTSNLLKKIIDANFPQNFIATIEGGPTIAAEILEQRFDHIFYTGSSHIGKMVMAAAANHLTPVTLELGGKCPAIVEPDADIVISAKRIAEGKWLNSGQTCIAPDYILTDEKTKSKLVSALQGVTKEMYGENVKGSDKYSRMVNHRHFDRVKALMDGTKGDVLYKAGELDRDDVFIPPILVAASNKDRLMEEEVFGPILPIVTIKNLDEAINVVNNGEKPLAAYLFTKDQQKVDKFLQNTSSGGVTINDILKHVFVPELPFGGIGNSGIGSYHGKHGFITLSHAKAILFRELA